MNLFLFPSITVFYYFFSFKCLFASDCSHGSHKRFHSPSPAAGSCCPDCPHPNPQDPTSLELQRGLAIWQGLPCCSQHLLELSGCWAESPLCTYLVLETSGQDDQYRAWSCRWMYSGSPTLDSEGTAPAGLSLGLLRAQRFRSCLCLSPASCFRHSGLANAGSPGSFWDGWCPWGRAVLLPSNGTCVWTAFAAVAHSGSWMRPQGLSCFPVARRVLGARSCFQHCAELDQLDPGELGEPAWLTVGHLACPLLSGL